MRMAKNLQIKLKCSVEVNIYIETLHYIDQIIIIISNPPYGNKAVILYYVCVLLSCSFVIKSNDMDNGVLHYVR